jgi:hypothetical protein
MSGFYDWKDTFPFLSPLLAEASSILEELHSNVNSPSDSCTLCNSQIGTRCKSCSEENLWRDWPETNLYKHKQSQQKQEWKVVPLCYSFPADDEKNTVWVEVNANRFPKTSSLLRALPGLRTALFSRLGPNTSLASHQGWAQLSNHVLRCHVTLSLPTTESERETLNSSSNNNKYCGMIVGDEIQYHEIGKAIVFDDSLLHSAFNNHPSDHRIVLIVDIARPATAPRGSAEKGKTEELEAFIREFH